VTVIIGAEAIAGALGMHEAIDWLEEASRHEAAGRTFVSPRLNATFERGWMRMMFAADYAAGYAATKAYHLVQGAGVRYVVTLYRLADGELLAVMDGRLITDLRTGAASGVLARRVACAEPVSVGLIGSGHQARMQLESLAAVYRVRSAAVFSPTAEHREAFAREMAEKHGFAVAAVGCAEEAVRGKTVVVAATSHRGAEPVLRADWLEGCRLLCGVGSTRPQSVELDPQCFRAARLTVVDSPRAAEEAGDLQQAQRTGALAADRQATLAQVVAGQASVPRDGLVLFKSVGTALQDLALAARCYERIGARPGLPAVARLASLKEPVSALGRAGA
jgi:ornithine cyclodeaminase/alanine dehydrogenase